MIRFRKQTLLLFALALGTGVTLAYNIHKWLYPGIALTVVAAIAALILFMLGRDKAKLTAIAAALFFFAVFTGGYSYCCAKIAARPEQLAVRGITFSGKVTGRPYYDNDGERFVCELTDLEINGEEAGRRFRLYLRGTAEELRDIGCGQTITGKGSIYIPGSQSNEYDFDFGMYLYRRGLYGYVTAHAENTTVKGERCGAYDLIYRAKTFLSERIKCGFGNNSDIVNALLLGERREMDTELRGAFTRAGVAHLLAVSGLHVSLIAAALALMLEPLFGRRAALVVSTVLIIMYGTLIGYTASVARAVIMFALSSVLSLIGRKTTALNRTAFAFALLLLINPLNIGDAGFVMSFMATAGIIVLVPQIEALLKADKVKNKLLKRVIDGICVCVCAQVSTLPAIAYYYSSVPVIAIATNIVVVPYTMLCMAVSAVGVVFPQIAFIPSAMISALKAMIGCFSSLDFAAVNVARPPVWLWAAVIAAIIAVSEISPLKENLRKYVLLVLPAVVLIQFLIPIDVAFRLVFLDAGQADCTLIAKNGRCCLIDTGEDGSDAISYALGKNLEIDAVFLTHPHSDHAGGIQELVEQCGVTRFYIPEEWYELSTDEDINREYSFAVANGAEFIKLKPGDTIGFEGTSFRILETAKGSGDPVNDISLSIEFECEGVTALFTGDGMALYEPDVDILKVGHHGSETATNEQTLEKTTPQYAIISCGFNNTYGHPSPNVVEMLEKSGCRIYRTDMDGTITISVKEDGSLEAASYK